MARRPLGGIVFMMIWIVTWAAAILVAVYMLGAEAMAGSLPAVVFLAAWIAAALFALSGAVRNLVGMLTGRPGGPVRRRDDRHHWIDDLPKDRPAPPPLPPGARSPDGS